MFDGKDWWAEGRATNGKKAKEDVQQGGVVGLEGGSWVAEKNGGNLRVAAVVLEAEFQFFPHVKALLTHLPSFCSYLRLDNFEFRR